MTARLFRSRYLILVCAVLMQTCLGATYSWSVFVGALKELTGLSQGPVQAPFTAFYTVFPATALFAGPVMARLGPRWSAVLGGGVFGGGWVVAGLGAAGFGYVLAGIGILGGIGVGLAYVVPIAMCVQWFPRNKGLVTGIAVAGFGGGAAVVTQVANWLLASYDATPYQVFRILGLAYIVVVGVAGLAMRRPPEYSASDPATADGARLEADGHSRTSEPIPVPARPRFRSVVAERPFQLLYVAMFCGLAAGFLVNANLKELARTATSQAGVTAVSLFAIANAAGRIGWGAVFDRVARPIRVLQANLLAQAALLVVAIELLGSSVGLQIVAVGAGFNYGGVLVLYASSVAARWGGRNVGHVYGWLFSANIPASAAPILAGFAYDRTGSFTGPLLAIAVLLFVGATLVPWGNPRSGPAHPRRP